MCLLSKYIILTCTRVHIHSRCALHKLFTQLIRLLLRKCILPSHRKCLVTCLIELVCVSIFLHGNTVGKTIILSTWQILHTWIGGLPSQRWCCRLQLRLIGKTEQLLHGACLLYLHSAPHFCGNYSNTHSKKKNNSINEKNTWKCVFPNKRGMHVMFFITEWCLFPTPTNQIKINST